MPVVLLRLPDLNPVHNGRPRQCPFCASQVLQRWGRVVRNVQDTDHRETEFYRYRCCECGRTFREYPSGVGRASQTQRIRYLAALTWAMGLSFRDVAEFFTRRGIDLSHSTVWRDGQELMARMNEQKDLSALRKYSIDPIFLKDVSPKFGIVIAIDLGDGKPEIVGTIDEFNPRSVNSWLEPFVKDIGIEVLNLGTGYLYQNVTPGC